MASFSRFQDVRNALVDLPVQDQGTIAAAQGRNTQLTKPPGSLGRLEDLAIWYAGWRGAERPELSHCQITVFAGNHGIAARGVSAFPQDVTAQMVANFRAGGAAVNQLASVAGARLDVVALQIDLPTADFTKGPAMTEAEFCKAFTAGWQAVDPAAELFVAGEMGIGNTTAAAAISAALFGGDGEKWVGRGTGVDDLVRVVADTLPMGPQLYPEEMYTDRPERFLASELVREQLYHQLGQELPYAAAVIVERFEERRAKNDVAIDATIYVERESQKGIVVGKGGARIRSVGEKARAEIGRLLGCTVHLKLFVKVDAEWSQAERGLRRMGYE